MEETGKWRRRKWGRTGRREEGKKMKKVRRRKRKRWGIEERQ